MRYKVIIKNANSIIKDILLDVYYDDFHTNNEYNFQPFITSHEFC